MDTTSVWHVAHAAAPGKEPAPRVLRLDQPRLMGIVNVTPDSFSDGGALATVEQAVNHALAMVDEGAAIIDVGGESTRPGARRVPAAEQIHRVIPVIEQLRARSGVLISIDTTLADVAEAALDAGADIINDVAAGLEDERTLPLAAERACGVILMHRRARPQDDVYSDRYVEAPVYDDVVEAVRRFVLERCEAALALGVERSAIVIDPGLGFGKTVGQNYQLIARMGELVKTGFPVLCSASRKSFVGAVSGIEEPRARVVGSTAVSVAGLLAGVRLFRVHDVAAHREALAVAAAINVGRGGG